MSDRMHESVEREREFYDRFWAQTRPRRIEDGEGLPVRVEGRRVLICSCGTGEDPVRAMRAGAAEVHAFDISTTAAAKAREMARHNEVDVGVAAMDFHRLAYADASFDVIFGRAILHHIECGPVGAELFRCLRPGGIAYFEENSDRNPVLRWVRRVAFGRPGETQRSRFLVFRRHGSSDEYPLTDAEIEELAGPFGGRFTLRVPRFVFFELLAIHGLRHPRFFRWMQKLDAAVLRLLPGLARFSFLQDVELRREG